MKIFGIELGKKEESNNKLIDKKSKIYKSEESISSSKDSPDPEDIIKYSSRISYKPYSRYQNYVGQIKNEGWTYVGDVQTYSNNNIDSNMVRSYPGKECMELF